VEPSEIISIFLGVTTAIAGTLAYAYKRGKIAGLDTACGKRIETKIDDMKKEGDQVHKELKTELNVIHSKIDHLTGSFETFKHLLNMK
jgi:hypothetical protein